MEASDVKTILKQCELFKTLEEGELDILLENGEIKQFSPGKILYMSSAK